MMQRVKVDNAKFLSCNYLSELSETYESFLTCTDNVLKDFKDALLVYLDSESPRSICDVASSFKKCVFKIADLPAKKLVSDMVKRSWHIYEHFSCAEFEPGMYEKRFNITNFEQITRKKVQFACAHMENSDHPAYLRSLISL